MEKPDEVLELFRHIESSYDIDKIRYKGLNFWPLLRAEIGFHLSLKVPAFEHSLPVRRRSFGDVLKMPYRFAKLWLAKRKFVNSVRAFNAESLFCTYPDTIFIDRVEGKHYSRYLDPYFEVLGERFKIERFSIRSEGEKNIDPLHTTVFLDLTDFKKYIFLRKYLVREKDLVEIENIKKVFHDINDITQARFGIRPAYSGIIKQFDEVIFYKQFTDVLMKKNAHVKNIFKECYYSPFKLALVASSKNVKAKVIEIQHGGAEDNVYVPYGKTTSKMDVLPELFWSWSYSDRDLLERHNTSSFPYLKPFVGGNMWLRKFIQYEMPIPAEHAAFISAVKLTYGKIVLLSLQFSIGLVDAMFNTISHAPKDVFFLVRFHPLTSEEERREIGLKLQPFENVETYMASAIHLYHLFSHVDFQITHSSTTAMEALSFEVPTIICSEFGYDYYKAQIERDVLFYSLNHEDILGIIAGGKTLNFDQVNHFLIQTDEQKALQALEQALNSCAA